MAGTYTHDSTVAKLVNGTLTSTATGSAVQVDRPGAVRFLLTTGTVTGTSPTLDVEIQASDSATFASGNVSLGKFAQVTASSASRTLQAYTQKRYVRAVSTVAGTTPSFGSVSVTVEERHFKRTGSDTA